MSGGYRCSLCRTKFVSFNVSARATWNFLLGQHLRQRRLVNIIISSSSSSFIFMSYRATSIFKRSRHLEPATCHQPICQREHIFSLFFYAHNEIPVGLQNSFLLVALRQTQMLDRTNALQLYNDSNESRRIQKRIKRSKVIYFVRCVSAISIFHASGSIRTRSSPHIYLPLKPKYMRVEQQRKSSLDVLICFV